MTKPRETKMLALIAAILGGAHFLLDVMIILFAEQLVPTFFDWRWEAELPLFIKCLVILYSVFSFLTIAGISLWSYLQQTVTVKKARGILIAQGIIYTVKLILTVTLNPFLTRLVSALSGNDTLAFYSYINMVRDYLTPLSAVALILICCSAAIELYITTHTDESAKESAE